MAGTSPSVRPSLPPKGALLIAAVLGAAALFQCVSYWPGIMTWDAITQYDQASQGYFEDWHPPFMAWIWRRLIAIHPGPAPLYLLQLGLYWTGYALIAAAAIRRRQRLAAWLVTACALMPFPLALMGSVLKDCLMQGFFLLGVGLFAWVEPERGWPLRIAAMAFLLLGALLRFNAFLAVVPLLVALLPRSWRSSVPRLATASILWLALVLVSMPLANRLIGAEKTHVALSLVMFDLGGITRHSGHDMFPPLGVADPVAVNARCYRPDHWDSYSFWADRPCPISFEAMKAAVERNALSPSALLIRAILAHPIAYAEHRLIHFNINSRFLVPNEILGAAPDRSIDNEWHFTVTRGPGLKLINALAAISIHSPLGWPIVWIAVAGGLLSISRFLPSAPLVVPLSLSALLYGLGYLPLSVSSELRYHLWTITGAAIAGAFAAADLAAGAPLSRRRLLAAFAPTVLIALLCTLSRLAALV
jgi:hypothetical protein